MRSGASRIYAFPQQFAGLRDVLLDFAQKVFSPSQFEQHPLLRGVYFVSGTQEGTPIDRMLGRLSRSFGLAGDATPAVPGQGRSYFLTRLLREVVFAESGLAGTNLKWERRRGAIALGGYALLALSVGAALFAWTNSYLNNRRYVAQVEDSLHRRRETASSPATNRASDPRPLLPRLQAAQNLPRATPDGSLAVVARLRPVPGRQARIAPPTAPTSACSSMACCRASRCASSSNCAAAPARSCNTKRSRPTSCCTTRSTSMRRR